MTPQDTTDFPHGAYCPVFQNSFELIGRRWTASIMRALFSGRSRFTDIAAAVPGLSHRLLAERLDELQEAGIVTVEPGVKRGTYKLTEQGCDLRSTFAELESWNERWAEEPAPQPSS